MRTIVLVLKNSVDFGMRDVQLIVHHICSKWKSSTPPRIICLWDKVSEVYDLGNIQLIPLNNTLPGTWSRMILYSPQMEQYRPFLYIDLDTAVIQSLENIFDLVKDESQFIALEDFWQGGRRLATPLVWIPANSEKVKKIWSGFTKTTGFRMDYYLRTVIQVDTFWQDITNTICDFKPNQSTLLNEIPQGSNLICFHGKPRIFDAVHIDWVNKYVNYE